MVADTRIARGLAACTCGQSMPIDRRALGGRLATTTSALLEQPAHDLLAGLGRRVEGEAALAPVHLQEDGAAFVAGDRRDEPVLAALDPLDPDDVGPEVAEQRRAPRPGDVAAEVDHLDPGQHAAGRRVSESMVRG